MRLIDADEAVKAVHDEFDECLVWDESGEATANEFENIILQMPTVDPVKHGEWIYGEHDIAMCDGYWCDQCGFFVPWDYEHKFIDFIKDYHWCPSCGAKMDEVEDDKRGEE